jgi:hypothetical protein
MHQFSTTLDEHVQAVNLYRQRQQELKEQNLSEISEDEKNGS